MNELGLQIEKNYWDLGYRHVVGVDEVGRGSLAGPVVAAAVLFPPNHKPIEGINDSKKLTPARRVALENKIRRDVIEVGVGVVSSNIIDKIGILRATRLAMHQACNQCKKEVILIDGPFLFELDTVCSEALAVVRGDQKIYSIAAASIVAKVYRDRLMTRLAIDYPQYDFAHNKGYGTKTHLTAIREHGATRNHRKSFIFH